MLPRAVAVPWARQLPLAAPPVPPAAVHLLWLPLLTLLGCFPVVTALLHLGLQDAKAEGSLALPKEPGRPVCSRVSTFDFISPEARVGPIITIPGLKALPLLWCALYSTVCSCVEKSMWRDRRRNVGFTGWVTLTKITYCLWGSVSCKMKIAPMITHRIKSKSIYGNTLYCRGSNRSSAT